MTDSNDVRITAKKNGTETVVKEYSGLGKDDFPFTFSQSSDGNTEYTITVNGSVYYNGVG